MAPARQAQLHGSSGTWLAISMARDDLAGVLRAEDTGAASLPETFRAFFRPREASVRRWFITSSSFINVEAFVDTPEHKVCGADVELPDVSPPSRESGASGFTALNVRIGEQTPASSAARACPFFPRFDGSCRVEDVAPAKRRSIRDGVR